VPDPDGKVGRRAAQPPAPHATVRRRTNWSQPPTACCRCGPPMTRTRR